MRFEIDTKRKAIKLLDNSTNIVDLIEFLKEHRPKDWREFSIERTQELNYVPYSPSTPYWESPFTWNSEINIQDPSTISIT